MAKKTPAKTAAKAAKTAATAKTKPVPVPDAASTETPKRTASRPRQLRLPNYSLLRLRRRHRPPVAKIPNAFRLFGRACKILAQQHRLFVGIVLVYSVLNFVFVAGFNVGGTDIASVKAALTGGHPGGWNFSLGTSLFAYLIGNSSSSTATTSAYQVLFVLISSLALIWALRQVYAGNKVRVRDAFYFGVAPLTIFTLVGLAISVQLVPLIFGAVLYATAIGPGVALHTIELIGWTTLSILLACISIYLVCSSLFALYISTLPDMTPLKALRSARQLVRYRRLSVLRKVLFIPVTLFVIMAAIMLPIIWFATPVAPWAFFFVAMLDLALFHSYMYALYRALL
ncbi:MAG TPA: hypothetical protein VLG11_02000 [Candidatus Saccharimonadales bacterium]|nr:hypothetical protein [Candidatus Saccharimonadales bacterium]